MDKFKISRRQLMLFSAALPLLLPLRTYALTVKNNHSVIRYPSTLLTLKQAYECEIIAHRHYVRYVEKALADKYPNIAYMFLAFSVSEKIHAHNYDRIITELGSAVDDIQVTIDVRDTRSNLMKASENEVEKIDITYPGFVKKLETEGCEAAIINCIYSWKSHRQHEKNVKKIQKYSGLFFGSVARGIEDLALDFHVCGVCGATIDEAPDSPCDICNRSMSHYSKIERPPG
jgi:rubrerythrin